MTASPGWIPSTVPVAGGGGLLLPAATTNRAMDSSASCKFFGTKPIHELLTFGSHLAYCTGYSPPSQAPVPKHYIFIDNTSDTCFSRVLQRLKHNGAGSTSNSIGRYVELLIIGLKAHGPLVDQK